MEMFWDKHEPRVPGKMADDNSKKTQAFIGHAMANLRQKNLSQLWPFISYNWL